MQAVPHEIQEMAPPDEAENFQLEALDLSTDPPTWANCHPEGWKTHWRPEKEWPEDLTIEGWAEWGLGELAPGFYRACWKPDDRRFTVERGPAFHVMQTGDVVVVDLADVDDTPPNMPPQPGRLPATAPQPRPPPAPKTTTAPPRRAPYAPRMRWGDDEPEQRHELDEGEELATLEAVMNPRLAPGMADRALQQFLIVHQTSVRQSDRFVEAAQQLAAATIAAERERSSALVEAVLRAQEPKAPAITPEQISYALQQAIAPLAERIDNLEDGDDADDEEQIRLALQRLHGAQERQPRSFLEQLTAFLGTPGGAALANTMQRAFAQAEGGEALPPAGGGGGA